jgi:hypothetical protein
MAIWQDLVSDHGFAGGYRVVADFLFPAGGRRQGAKAFSLPRPVYLIGSN